LTRKIKAALGPLLALYPASLTAAHVTDAAALHLEFGSGATLVVPQNAHYEAWEVDNGTGWQLVCMRQTSGDIAEWNPR
jgi:hypothetical protein